MSSVETRQMSAAETSVLSQQKSDPDHEIQDFDQLLPENLRGVCSIPFWPSTLQGLFRGTVTSALTAFLQGILFAWTSSRILPAATAPTLDRQNASAKSCLGTWS